jgi:hypothetical protein
MTKMSSKGQGKVKAACVSAVKNGSIHAQKNLHIDPGDDARLSSSYVA